MQSAHADIVSFIAELAAIPFSDPLVDLNASKNKLTETSESGEKPFFLEAENRLNAILRTATINKKDADLNTLCISLGTVSWIFKDKKIVSPLLLVPLVSTKQKSSSEIKFVPQTDSVFLNPFLRYNLFSDVAFDEAENTIGALEEKTRRYLEPLQGLQFTAEKYIGNFHHHRYALLREMEALATADKLSPLVETLLGNESVEDNFELRFSKNFLTASDPDQKVVFDLAQDANLVIQGPPGTGKSQVLTNIIGKRLPFAGMTLVVSEKKSALDVLISKLKKSGLGHVGFLAHSQIKPKEFVLALKANWKLLEEENYPDEKNQIVSEQLHGQLQIILNKLSAPGLIGGLSFSEFKQLKFDETAGFASTVPTLNEWLKFLPDLEKLSGLILKNGPFSRYKKELLINPRADQILERIFGGLRVLSGELNLVTFSDLENLPAVSSRIQLLENEVVKSWFHLHKSQKEQKQFTRLRQQYKLVSDEIKLKQNELQVWKTIPAQSQLDSWIQELQNKLSWFAARRYKKIANAYLKDNSTSLFKASANLLALLKLEEEKLALTEKFQKLGIDHPETELEAAGYVIEKLGNEDPNELNVVMQMDLSRRNKIIQHETHIKQLINELRSYCNTTADTTIESLLKRGEDFSFVPFLKELSNLPASFFQVLANVSSLKEANDVVVNSNWMMTLANFPELRNYDPKKLKALLDEILEHEEEEFCFFSRKIKFLRKQQFERYAELLRTPSTKLSADEKELKKRLKSGKALLVKEFSKSKQHLSIRKFFSSEARIWIELLTPVWLTTPAQMATFFPMEADLFDLVVFDEASQIPLPNALGSLQRSKRAIVAGDDQQMSPSNYFSGIKSSSDLLHQAGFYWKNTALRHHYRSVHPALIAFSNKHFYRNRLIAFSSPNTNYPLQRHFVENGIFSDRANEQEAREVAGFLETLNWKEHIGITAFSGQQLETIWNVCSEAVRNTISEGIEKGTVFFKALESVQGDECDVLVISMGYGKNDEGDFHLRFGPLNQANGHKRLNVLLTRARKKLHFFTSVTSAEIALSRNESVNLLRAFLLQLENPPAEEELTFHDHLQTTVSDNKLVVSDVHQSIPDSHELSTFYRVMKERGWKVSFE